MTVPEEATDFSACFTARHVLCMVGVSHDLGHHQYLDFFGPKIPRGARGAGPSHALSDQPPVWLIWRDTRPATV